MKRKVSPLDVPRAGFGLLSIFDSITPLFKGFQWIKNDAPPSLKTWTFRVPNTKSIHKGWSQKDIKRLLKEHGILVYGDQVYFGHIELRVPIAKAAEAEDLLNRYGIPIQPRSQGAPRSQKQRPSPFDLLPRHPARCAYCGSFDLRKGKCHNCGAIS